MGRVTQNKMNCFWQENGMIASKFWPVRILIFLFHFVFPFIALYLPSLFAFILPFHYSFSGFVFCLFKELILSFPLYSEEDKKSKNFGHLSHINRHHFLKVLRWLFSFPFTERNNGRFSINVF